MNKLLHADFARLFRKKLFWFESAFMLLYPVFLILLSYRDTKRYGYTLWFEENVWTSGSSAVIAMAILVPMYIGTEYADRTVRNKLIMGHGKGRVFLSNMITMISAAVILMTIWNVVYFALGGVLMEFCNPFGRDILICLEVYAAVLFMTAMLVFISMFITYKGAAAAVCMVFCLSLMLFGMLIKTRLGAPEMISKYMLENPGADAEFSTNMNYSLNYEMVPNPDYIPEGRYKEFLRYTMRTSVGAQLADVSNGHEIVWEWFLLFDNIMIAAISVGGALLYKRKEIS